jgi:hypothetical protein
LRFAADLPIPHAFRSVMRNAAKGNGAGRG